MQIVIDIPDEDVPNKQEIMEIDLHFIDGEVCECTYPYIVLPKEHEDLIDGDKIMEIHGIKSIPAVLNAPIIIEADKAERSEE